MADNFIEDFLVRVGFKVDASSEKRFTDAVQNATLRATLLADAIEAAAKTVAKAVADMAANFEQLYYSSQRTNASVKNLQSLGYAVSQLGGSYDGAMNSVNNFARLMRNNPGYTALVRSLGVSTEANGKLRDTTDILKDLGKVFASQKYEVGRTYAETLGLDDETFRILRNQPEALERLEKQHRKTAASIGFDADAAAKASTEFMQSLRTLADTVGMVAQKIFTDLSPALLEFLNRINDWIAKHPEEIKQGIIDIGKALTAFAKAAGEVAVSLLPALEGIGKIGSSLMGDGGVKSKMEEFLVFLFDVWLARILAAFAGVGSAWGTMLALLGIELYKGSKTGKALVHGGRPDVEYQSDLPGVSGGYAPPPPPPPASSGDGRSWWQRTAPKWLGGKDASEAPASAPSASPGSAAPISGTTFGEKAPGVMQRLMDDFGLSKDEAAVVLGNLGHESGGFKHYQEIKPLIPGSRGGAGWAQWTGPRRIEFEKWAAKNNLDTRSDEANYGFLKHELQGTHAKALRLLKSTEGNDAKMRIFEDQFEGSEYKAYGSRFRFMEQARRAYDADQANPWSPNKAGQYNWNGVAEALGRYDFGSSKRASEAEPLGIGPTNNSTWNNVTMSPNTTIKIDGAGNPNETASAVARAQTNVNELTLRNTQSALR